MEKSDSSGKKRRQPGKQKKAGAKTGNEQVCDYIFTFRYPRVTCILDQQFFSDQDRDRIEEELQSATREICIDKSYVAFKGSKYEKVFMSEEGWNMLCRAVTEFKSRARTSTKKSKIQIGKYLREVYQLMVAGYLYQLFEDMGYDQSRMSFYVRPVSELDVKVEKDGIREWARYPGKWQTWLGQEGFKA